MMEKQQIGLDKREWKLVLSALVIAQNKSDDNFAKLYRKIRELLGEGGK